MFGSCSSFDVLPSTDAEQTEQGTTKIEPEPNVNTN